MAAGGTKNRLKPELRWVWSPGFSRWSCRTGERLEIFRRYPVCEHPTAWSGTPNLHPLV